MIVMAGPCVIESEEQLDKIASDLAPLNARDDVEFYFKASFDKANRTSLENYRGLGIDEGLRLLKKIKEKYRFKIITDIHETNQIAKTAEVADILQIPALLCRQTDLIVQSAKTTRIINIKKGQFLNPRDMQYAVLKALKTRNNNAREATYEDSKKHKIWITERGSSFGYGNLVVDMRGITIMRNFAPVIFDATHSVQMPGAGGGKSSGDSSFVIPLAKAAAAVGVDGFFMEAHFDPKNALSDGANMIESTRVAPLVDLLIEISKTSKKEIL